RPAAGAKVRALYSGFASPATPISGAVRSGADGRYRLLIDPGVLRALNVPALHLQIDVDPGDGGVRQLSDVGYGATLPAVVDVRIDREIGPTEFEIISARV